MVLLQEAQHRINRTCARLLRSSQGTSLNRFHSCWPCICNYQKRSDLWQSSYSWATALDILDAHTFKILSIDMDLSKDFLDVSQIYQFLHQSKFYSICLLWQHLISQDRLCISFVNFSSVGTFCLGECPKNWDEVACKLIPNRLMHLNFEFDHQMHSFQKQSRAEIQYRFLSLELLSYLWVLLNQSTLNLFV